MIDKSFSDKTLWLKMIQKIQLFRKMTTMVEPDRPMARILRISGISDIPKCQKIVLAKVSGWQCVIKKDEFKIGDLVIYFSIDSVLPSDNENFSFLKSMEYRVKSVKIRGVLSQGIIGPLTWLSMDVSGLKEFDDVTKILGVRKYVHPEELSLYTGVLKRPEYVRRTDEERLQNSPEILETITNRTIVITRKEDGTSASFVFHEKKFYICSRNLILTNRTIENDHYYWVAEKYKMEDVMRKYDRDIAIQGEIVGPGVQENRLLLDDLHFEVFNIWDIVNQQYLEHYEVIRICKELGLEHVPVVYLGTPSLDIEWYMKMSEEQRYGNEMGEGIVIKTIDGLPRVSFKIVSNAYLLKHGL